MMLEKFDNTVLQINNGNELEEFRDFIIDRGMEGLFMYDDTFVKGDIASSGYFHYDKELQCFYLSKNADDKNIITLNDLL